MAIALTPVTGDPKIAFTFWCPGCDCHHIIGTSWEFDGNMEAPTVSPSILVRTRDGDIEHACHMLVKAGKIQYLADCTHALAGTTIDMVPVEDVRGYLYRRSV